MSFGHPCRSELLGVHGGQTASLSAVCACSDRGLQVVRFEATSCRTFGFVFGRQAPGKGIAEQVLKLRNKKIRACIRFPRQALDIDGARSRNRTGTPLRAGDFKSHASTSFAIRAVAR